MITDAANPLASQTQIIMQFMAVTEDFGFSSHHHLHKQVQDFKIISQHFISVAIAEAFTWITIITVSEKSDVEINTSYYLKYKRKITQKTDSGLKLIFQLSRMKVCLSFSVCNSTILSEEA